MRACGACGQPVPIKWRDNGPPPVLEHVAGGVVDEVEPRRSCPGYIADRWQRCARCKGELVHGRWAVFFLEGEVVLQIGYEAPIFTGGALLRPDAVRCSAPVPAVPLPRDNPLPGPRPGDADRAPCAHRSAH